MKEALTEGDTGGGVTEYRCCRGDERTLAEQSINAWVDCRRTVPTVAIIHNYGIGMMTPGKDCVEREVI